ncbi:TonB-dependent receptor domain-containing protein [Novosphingobium arvoryzae]|uniref:TonB-dependent receptor n=1 Tax=Novosphingobium arvoryzae TaxID=1256514 RepID=A0A918VD04_9SPHN|nr:TonB-dependent receptor [Novosphingobium arvoryzae]GGZ87781.1 TonB-dependent receptor [Novosphingobium arvoryzae]
MTGSTTRRTRRIALLLGCCLATLGWADLALAQDQADEANTAEDGIVVTGSRVRGEAPVGATVIALGRSEIEASGASTVDRMIKEIPQNFDLGVSENSRGQSGGSGNIVYGNTVNLRGIGPYATLVLIDGHRVTNNSRSVDPSILPSLGVERVEVVADGASAIYGSDAVAGVVNIIPRRTLNGAEAMGRYGISDDGKFDEKALGLALGKVFDRGQVMIAYEHVERDNLSGDDRAFFTSNQTAFGGPDGRTTRCYPGTIRAGGVTYAIPAGGVTQATAGSLVAGSSNKCDIQSRQDLFPRQKYDSVNGTGRFDLTDWLTVSLDAFYSKRSFYRRSAYSSASVSVPQTNAFFVRPAGFAGTSYTVDYMFKELPANDSYGFAESWQITPSVKVKLPHDFELELLAGYGKTRDLSESYYGINNAALNAALASSNPATAFDIYGGGRTDPALYATLANQIFIAPTNGRLKTYEARLNGALFELPGGSVKLATGYERQEFKVALGSARGGPTTPLTFRNFGRSVDSVYAEVYVPIFGSGNATPGFERLELNAAVRHDKYSDVGSTTNPKFGINWVPVDGVKLRGSYGTSFRAPTIPEIYGNSNNLFVQNYSNPTGGTITGVALSGQNLNLRPETASTWSIGADFDPLPGLKLGVTYWDVKYENQVIANLSNLAILGNASIYNGTNILYTGTAAGAQVQSYINAGIGVVGTLPVGGASAVTVFVDGRSQNLGVSITRGIDFTANYRTDISANDSLTFNLSGTYLTKYRVAVTPAAPLNDQLNLIFNPLKFKLRGSVTWDHGPLSLRALLTHVGGYTNNIANPAQSVGSFNPVDLSLTWKVGDKDGGNLLTSGLTLGLEVRNVFNERPPYVNIAPSGNGSGGYDATAADPLGRVFAATIRKSF